MTQVLSQADDAIYTNDSSDEFAYKSVSRAATLSIVFGLFGLLSWISPLLLFLPLIGFVFGVVAIRNIKKYPNELIGSPIAWSGVLLSGLMTVCSPVRHIYIYYTEVPVGFERVQFAVLNSPRGAPDIPTPEAIAMNGKKVFLKGYIHPTSISSASAKTFVLVPDMGTCCFGTQPPLTNMIQVRLVNDDFAYKSIRLHSIAGTLEVLPFLKPVEGLEGVYYEFEAEHFK